MVDSMLWLSRSAASFTDIVYSGVVNLLSTISKDLLHVCLTLFCVIVLIIALSFIKCLEPKYRLVDPNGRYGHAISASCARETYRQLPWLYTRSDIETVHWINQSLSTLWPSLQTLTNKLLLDFYKPKVQRKWTLKESKQLVEKSAKLSLILSSKRKLTILRNRMSESLSCTQRTYSFSSLIANLSDSIKIFIIHFKQFIMDFIATKFLGIQSKQLTRLSDMMERLELKQARTPKTWAGATSKLAIRKKFLSRSAPTELNSSTGRKMVFKALKSVEKFRRKRIALAEFLENLAIRTKQAKTVKVDRIRLGRSCPIISGFKLIDDQTRCIEEVKGSDEIRSFKSEQNLRFSGEITFSSGPGFSVMVSQLPLLKAIELQSLRLKVRFSITINHSMIEHNDDLEILSNDLGSRLPKINYIQVAPVDVPELDWFIQSTLTEEYPVKSLLARLMSSQNLIWILNHPYFKFFSHNVLYILLKWFDSFDIRVGSKVYFRSLL